MAASYNANAHTERDMSSRKDSCTIAGRKANASGFESDGVDGKERELALELRKHCTPWGVENNIYESAAIFMQLGKHYLKKAHESHGFQQKLNYVKSAALLAGAKVRFEKLCNEQKIAESRKEYRGMCVQLLENAGASPEGINSVFNTIKHTARLASRYRKELAKDIKERLTLLSDDLAGKQLLLEREKRIKDVSELSSGSTVKYKALMKGVSEACINILGPPPCKFALVGLGSLGRAEVTLYSDFEHVILLEDSCLVDCNLENYKEYFRWYSVIFQVIVIGLGETRIPSVGVESLNDLYSEDKSKNWFFDSVTPGGISFDGRFPHASKTPLGKQEPSKYRTHTVELIQPVSEMLRFLETEEDLKNGYHLREMLFRSCYVHGDENTHRLFVTKVTTFLFQQDHFKFALEQLKFVEESEEFFMNKSQDAGLYEFHRVKDVFYRPIATIAACLSLVWGILADSSFEFFDFLREFSRGFSVTRSSGTGVTHLGNLGMDKILIYMNNVEYALAVACEIRLKFYAETSEQKGSAPVDVIPKLVGKSGRLHICRTVLYFWLALSNNKKGATHHDIISKIVQNGKKISFSGYEINDVLILRKFGFEDDAFEIEKTMYLANQGTMPVDLSVAQNFIKAGEKRPDKQSEYLQIAEHVLNQIAEEERGTFQWTFAMAICFDHNERYQEAIDILEKWVEMYKKKGGKYEEYVGAQWLKMQCLRFTLPSTDMLEYFKKQALAFPDTCSQIISLVGIFFAHYKSMNLDDAETAMREASRIYRENAEDVPPSLAMVITNFFQGFEHFGPSRFSRFSGEMLENTANQMQHVSQGQQQWYLNKQSISRIRDGFTSKEQRPDLKILIEQGILKSRDFQEILASVPVEFHHRNEVYNGLLSGLSKAYAFLAGNKLHGGLRILDTALKSFALQLSNPTFTEVLRNISQRIAAIHADLVFVAENRLSPLFGHSGRMTKYSRENLKDRARKDDSKKANAGFDAAKFMYFNALVSIQVLDLENGIRILWKIVTNASLCDDVMLKNECCYLLMHAVNAASLPAVVQRLIKRQSLFMSRYRFPVRDSFPLSDKSVKSTYNDGIEKFGIFNYKDSVARLWKVTQQAKSGSLVMEYAIRMVQHVIISVWDARMVKDMS